MTTRTPDEWVLQWAKPSQLADPHLEGNEEEEDQMKSLPTEHTPNWLSERSLRFDKIGGKFALASGEEANNREKSREVYCPQNY